MIRVLVVDDDPLACRILTRMLGPEFQVHSFEQGQAALEHFRDNGAELLLTDLSMPRMGGLELLTEVKKIDSQLLVFVITGHSTLETAVTAVKQGAYDFIAKPFDPDDVLLRINRALKERRLEETVTCYQRSQDRDTPLTRNPQMLQILELARRAARTDSTILIQGETGVGKELVACAIHQWSPRREQPFVPVNCGALAEGVLESELFGHEKGAFTGAHSRRIGYFELASRGTLFLDEIGTTGNAFQVKLLRVLQERTVQRVGGGISIPVDSRIIAATNQDLEAEAHLGRFRPDLYYRLGVVTLTIPPLRDRPEDVMLLASHFLERYRSINPQIRTISTQGRQLLAGYHYPGNVRELENIIERAMILETGSELTPESLLIGCQNEPAGTDEGESLRIDEAEQEHILRVLKSCNGRKLEAARLLGINKTTLWRKMKRYGIDEESV
ncbi:MAG: sigma-54 dependent transcriptional regulator [Trichlorobacter sp.]|jgi:DNA-binding NtrC family response regulator